MIKRIAVYRGARDGNGAYYAARGAESLRDQGRGQCTHGNGVSRCRAVRRGGLHPSDAAYQLPADHAVSAFAAHVAAGRISAESGGDIEHGSRLW